MTVGDENKNYVFDDSKIPALPYIVGACFEIKQHKRLAPFDNGQCYEFPKVSSLSEPLLPTDVLSPNKISKPRDNRTPWTWEHSPSDPSRLPPDTITERYLRHRPRKTESHGEDGTTRRLEILRQIRVRDGAYAQVVQCRVDGIQGPLVAKIFDPLYRWEDVELDEPQSPVGLCESEWSCEAAAYERIQEGGLEGVYTPRFEGCWSFNIPWELELVRTTTGGHRPDGDEIEILKESSKVPAPRTVKLTRNVRLLLMEWVPGDNMLNLLETGNYRDIPPDVRMELLARLAEAQSALWHIRVSHGDLHSRNVVVGRNEKHDEADEQHVDDVDGSEERINNRSSSYTRPEKADERPPMRRISTTPRAGSVQGWHVVLIDFGQSVVRDLPNAKINVRGRLAPALPRPQNPITRCRGSWPMYPVRVDPDWDDAGPGEEANWIDKKYDTFEARRKWMESKWGRGTARGCRYQPIEYDKLREQTKDEE